MSHVRIETADTLRGLAMGESSVVEGVLGVHENLEDSGLDQRLYGLVKLASLIALDAPQASYVALVAVALDAGATPEELLGVLVAVSPEVGMPKVVAAAPRLMLALGLTATEP
jgi:alkylhydroperoxidase/carboxymuconolactone decarboxylase family protein YurZ